MASIHDAMSLYYRVRDLALAAQIQKKSIEDANLAYAELHVLIVRAKLDESLIPALQDEIMSLPTKLISVLGIATGFDEVREAILNLPTALMDILSPVIDFEFEMAE